MARMWGRQTPNWQVGKQINAAAGSESGVPGTMRVQPGRATFLSPSHTQTASRRQECRLSNGVPTQVGPESARVSRAGEASRRAPFKLVAAEVTRLQIPGAAAGSSVASRQSEPPDVGCYHLRRTAAAVRGSVLECGSPLPLFLPSVMKPRSTFRPWSNSSPSESARGLDALQALAECCCRFAMIEIGREGVSPSPYSGTAACGPSKPDL